MANVGDLFVNVRARTSALTKGLQGARRRMSNFAKSSGGMIAGIAAGFGLFKLGEKFLGAMVYHSEEFGQAWANINNVIQEMLGELANELGPVFAQGANDLADWMKNSEGLRDLFEGLGMVFESVLIPGARKFFEFMDKASTIIADAISWATGVSETQQNLAMGLDENGDISWQAAERTAQDQTRRGALMAKAARASAAGDSAASEMYLRQIRDRLEVPQ
jgi:hypothetical protein